MSLIARGLTCSLGCAVLVVTSCDPTTQPPPPPVDSAPPTVQVAFPTSATEYDEDGDQFLDLTVIWSDSGSGVDPATATLTATPGVSGPAGTGDLLPGWRVEVLDSTRLVAHELLQNQLRSGSVRLRVTVADSAGNATTAQVDVTLPYAEYLKTIQTGLLEGPDMQLTVCQDDLRLYGTAGWNLVVVDAETLALVGVYRNDSVATPLFVPLCVPGDSVLYVTSRVERFNRNTMTWLSQVTGSFGSRGIVQSRFIPRRLYVGEWNGIVAVIDRTLNQRIRTLPIPPGDEEWDQVYALAVSNRDGLLYFSRSGDGIIIADTMGIIHGRVPLWGPPRVLRLAPDQSSLYAVDDRGLWEMTPNGGLYLLRVPTSYESLYFDLSPSGARAFITTRDDESDPLAVDLGHDLLVDVATGQVLATFPHERLGWAGGVAFHPSGKLIYAARNFDIKVFLNRE